MPPDLNSLPPSRSTSNSPLQTRPTMAAPPEGSSFIAPPSPSLHSPSLSSLQAAAAINAGMHSSSNTSPRFERRRSSLMTNLQLNDPTIPGPGEMVNSHRSPSQATRTRSPLRAPDPYHQRAPSLGQIHQELENEQEAQVNRLLQMIRVQQDQITALQPTSPTSSEPSSHIVAPVHSTTDVETRSRTASNAGIPLTLMQASQSMSPSQRPMSLSRQSSRAASGMRSSSQSPALRPMSSYDAHRDDWTLGPTGAPRDDNAFYQAETQSLTRENQLLKQRIRELERQLGESTTSTSSGLGLHVPNNPAAISPLASPPATASSQLESS